jgi:hypothetical protein
VGVCVGGRPQKAVLTKPSEEPTRWRRKAAATNANPRTPRATAACGAPSRNKNTGEEGCGTRRWRWEKASGLKARATRVQGLTQGLDRRNATPYGYVSCVAERLHIEMGRRSARWRIRQGGRCWICCGREACRQGKSREPFPCRGRRYRSICDCCGGRGWYETGARAGSASTS